MKTLSKLRTNAEAALIEVRRQKLTKDNDKNLGGRKFKTVAPVALNIILLKVVNGKGSSL